MADRATGLVIFALGIVVAIGAMVDLARSSWRQAFVELFVLGIFLVPMMAMRLHRYSAERRERAAPDR